MNLRQDIQDVIDSKSPKEAAIFKIQLQPYFNTLAELGRTLVRSIAEMKAEIDAANV